MNAPGFTLPDAQQLFDYVPGLLLVLAPDSPRFTILAATDAYLSAVKRARGEVIGQALFDLFPDGPGGAGTEAALSIRVSLDRVIAARAPDTTELQRHDLARPDAEGGGREERYWNVVNTPVMNASGEVAFVIHRIEDVTEPTLLRQRGAEHRALAVAREKEAETLQAMNQALRESRRAAVKLLDDAIASRQEAELAAAALGDSVERLRILVESTATVLWEATAEGELVEDIPSWQSFSGQAPKGWQRGGWLNALHPDDRERVVSEWQEVMRAGAPGSCEFRVQRADGAWRWMSGRASPIRLEDGRIRRWVGMLTDVTDRKVAEETLRAHQERIRLATEATGVGIWEWNVKTDRVRWDTQMFRLYGIAPTSDGMVDYAEWRDMVLEEDRPGQEEALREIVRHRRQGRREFRIRRSDDGEHRWVEAVDAIRASPSGEVEWVVGTNLDITERKLAHEAIANADRRKDEFLATLAHELRNPLAPAWNAVQTLRLKASSLPELKWEADLIDRQIRQMVRLINDLMDVGRISRGTIDLVRERVDLARVIQGAIETSRPLIDEGGHDLTVSLPRRPVIVDADPTRLTQVFANLLNNAARYTPRGGQIELRAEQQGGELVVSVRDTGVGIPAGSLQTIFGMFSRGEGVSSGAHVGLGIGLFLVKQLVEKHGGTIEARSEGPGRGSELTVRLPIVVAQSDADAEERDAEEKLPTSDLRIVVVDDNRDAAASMALFLEMTGNTVRTAHDGEEALAVARELKPHVALLDIGLPKMDGYEVARAIRRQPGGDKMVLVAVTGWSQEKHRQRSKQAGFDHHMVKPVDPLALMKVLAGVQPAKV